MAYKFNNYRYIQDKLFITCQICKIEKPEEDFYIASTKLKREYTCRICSVERKRGKKLDTASLDNAQGAKDILISMGYNIEKPIYPQFTKRIVDKYGTKL